MHPAASFNSSGPLANLRNGELFPEGGSIARTGVVVAIQRSTWSSSMRRWERSCAIDCRFGRFRPTAGRRSPDGDARRSNVIALAGRVSRAMIRRHRRERALNRNVEWNSNHDPQRKLRRDNSLGAVVSHCNNSFVPLRETAIFLIRPVRFASASLFIIGGGGSISKAKANFEPAGRWIFARRLFRFPSCRLEAADGFNRSTSDKNCSSSCAAQPPRAHRYF